MWVMWVYLDQRQWRGVVGGGYLRSSAGWPITAGPPLERREGPQWRGRPLDRSADSGPRRLSIVPGFWAQWALLSRRPRVRCVVEGSLEGSAPPSSGDPGPRQCGLFTTRGRQRVTQQGLGSRDPEKLGFSGKETGAERPRDP